MKKKKSDSQPVSYLTSYWGLRHQPQHGGVGAGVSGMVAESWRGDERLPGDLTERHRLEHFHLLLQGGRRAHYCLQPKQQRWAHATRCFPPRDSAGTLMEIGVMIKRTVPIRLRPPCKPSCTGWLCTLTAEEVALAIQYLADLKGPDLPHTRVGRVKHVGVHRGVGVSSSEDKLAGIAFHVLLQTQTAHLRRQPFPKIQI